MTTPDTIPAGYKEDSQGRLVPLSQIRAVDLTRDSLVLEIVARARELNRLLREFRVRTHDDIQAFAALSADHYGARIGGRKGNLCLVSFDGRYKVLRAISDQLVFDERLQAAKALIDECIGEWIDGSRAEIRTLIQDAFVVDKAGTINTGRILSLRRLSIQDERWKRAMGAISESLQVASSKSYIRVYERVGNTDQYVPIALDLANA